MRDASRQNRIPPGLSNRERERDGQGERRGIERQGREDGMMGGKKTERHDLRNIPLSAALLHYQANVLFPEVMLTLNEAFLICRSEPGSPAPLSCEGKQTQGSKQSGSKFGGDFLPL